MKEKTTHDIALAKKAMRELDREQTTSVRCPKCGEAPEITITPNGERTIISCPCRYIYEMEINF